MKCNILQALSRPGSPADHLTRYGEATPQSPHTPALESGLYHWLGRPHYNSKPDQACPPWCHGLLAVFAESNKQFCRILEMVITTLSGNALTTWYCTRLSEISAATKILVYGYGELIGLPEMCYRQPWTADSGHSDQTSPPDSKNVTMSSSRQKYLGRDVLSAVRPVR